MKIGQTFSICMISAVLAVGAVIYAQESRSSGERQSATTQERQLKRELKEKHLAEVAAGTTVHVAFANSLEYRIAAEPIKGAPFSAQVVIEDTQTLANGVHINHKSTGMLYRDSEGRTRSEEPRDGGPEIVLINDPVARVDYHLHMLNQTAVKVTHAFLQEHRQMEELNAQMEQKHAEMERKHMAEAHDGEVHSERLTKIRVAITDAQLKEDRQLGRERKVESLGTQTVEGVQAVGTRVTFTFAAGTEGNDQPFDVVSEKWYSPELQTVVMTRHSDPRSGENVYRLTNINRSEPARSLFEAPPDFRLKEESIRLPRKQ